MPGGRAEPGSCVRPGLARFANGRDVSYADADGKVRDHPLEPPRSRPRSSSCCTNRPGDRSSCARSRRWSAATSSPGKARRDPRLRGRAGRSRTSRTTRSPVPTTASRPRQMRTTSGGRGLCPSAWRAEPAVGRGVPAAQYPCLSWPYQPATGDRPAADDHDAVSGLRIGRDGRSDHADRGRSGDRRPAVRWLLDRHEGGPHVTFGRGRFCVDDPVLAWLLDGHRPHAARSTATADIIDGYIALTPDELSGYDTRPDRNESPRRPRSSPTRRWRLVRDARAPGGLQAGWHVHAHAWTPATTCGSRVRVRARTAADRDRNLDARAAV